MKKAATNVLALAFAGLLLSLPAVGAGQSRMDVTPLPGARLEDSIRGGFFLVLSDNRLLVWNDFQKARIRATDSHWGPMLRVPFRLLGKAVPDSLGFLLSGTLPDGHPVVALFDTTGAELRRWLPAEPVFSACATRKGRWGVADKGLLPLLGDGRTGKLQPFPEGFSSGSWGVLLYEGQNRVLCSGHDPSLAHRASTRCEELASDGWSFKNGDAELSLACGPWLILRDGPSHRRLVVRSLRTGALMKTKDYGGEVAVACVDSQTLAIGGKALESARLPSLKTLSKRNLRRGRIGELAVLRDEIVFNIDSVGMYFVSRKDR